ncbi:MAG: vitamin K epoxide reductase [Halieaceae bacterium]|nr:vitamin K epoxide reductase [Halieaceae bacterium]
MRRGFALFLTVLTLVLVLTPTGVQADDQAVVRAVLFYSPTCPHCHKVIDEDLSPLQKQYGDQLRIALINVATDAGRDLYLAAAAEVPIADNQRGVPAMVVGDTLLVGSYDIPTRFPGIIEAGLAENGIAWPAITGMDTVGAELDAQFETIPVVEEVAESAALEEQPAEESAQAIAEVSESADPIIAEESQAPAAVAEDAIVLAGEDGVMQQAGIMDLLRIDPVAAVVAILVLLLMIASVLIAAITWLRHGLTSEVAKGWQVWIIPALSVVGLLVAGYLAFVETTETAAVCGPVGDCNTVQQSSYARLFGVLPIGVLGIAGYLVVLALWAWQRYGAVEHTAKTVWLLPAVALTGVLFSIYLTALELFVIIAVCMWCITSAIIMTLVLWFTYRWQLPPAKQVAERTRTRRRHAPH